MASKRQYKGFGYYRQPGGLRRRVETTFSTSHLLIVLTLLAVGVLLLTWWLGRAKGML